MANPLSEFRAVIFDLDGTLLDSAPDLAYAINQMLAALGRDPVSLNKVQGWIGNGLEVLVQRALSDDFIVDPDLSAELTASSLTLFKGFYADALHHYSRLYPNALAVLQALKQSGYKLAIVTNKATQFTLPLLQQFALTQLIDLVVCGDTLAKKKPDPDPLLFCAEQFELPSASLVMVGDSRNDIQAAKAAKMASIGLTYGYNYGEDIALCEPDWVLDDLSQLSALLTTAKIDV